jgi:hypothetical protein
MIGIIHTGRNAQTSAKSRHSWPFRTMMRVRQGAVVICQFVMECYCSNHLAGG